MNILWYIENSIRLDVSFLMVSRWQLSKKLRFILLKYLLVLKHIFTPFRLGQSSIQFGGNKIYYDTQYGLAGYQSMMARHQLLIQISKIKSVKTVIDVGANVGFFTLLSRDLYPRAKIYSLEPAPVTFSCLKENVKGDKNIYSNRLGLSNKSEFSFMEFDPKKSAFSAVRPTGNIRVKLTTLDKFIRSKKIVQLDFLKIDTETHELNVLKGAKKALAKTRYLHIEVTLVDNPHYTFSRLLKELSSSNYDFQLLAYRSYTDKGTGKATVFDLLLKNTYLQ